MRTKEFLSKIEHDRVVAALRKAERITSGPVRLFIQRGHIGDALAAAQQKFEKLKLRETPGHNAVLIFVAPRDHKFAVVGDSGVHEKCGDEFWNKLVDSMRAHFRNERFTDALIHGIDETASLLASHFPKSTEDDAGRVEI